MSNTADFSVEDEHYLSVVLGEPKMTMDEVGADIDEHGHIPVTPETATQNPFSTKGSLANALDELEGEIEGTIDTPQSGLIEPDADGIPPNEPMIQQDSAVSVKDSLSDALDTIVMDANPSDYTEEKDPMPRDKAPNLPTSLGGEDDKPDENGLVYITRTFTVDPNRYISTNYRPNPAQANINPIKPLAKSTVNPQEEAELSDLGTPEARESAQESDEPTATEEAAAAQEANNEEQKEEEVVEVKETEDVIPAESKGKKSAKSAQDEAIAPQEKVALDYATFIDGSSFLCFDEISDIDYTKIAMDAGPKKKVTRENCQTTFAQCRAKNPLFCRFHGPKLLEADIKTAIKSAVGPGCLVSVTKDKNAPNPLTFRLTVGCPPSKKKIVEKMIHMFLTQNPGISAPNEEWTEVGNHKESLEFEMDILKADAPPQKNDLKGQKSVLTTKKDKANNKIQGVVGETSPALEKKAAKGKKWETVDEATEEEWAGLVDDINKSLIANNTAFIENFHKIANQFDEAHDKGDVEGLKDALGALKEEIGKYDSKGNIIFADTSTDSHSKTEAGNAAGKNKPSSPTTLDDDESQFDALVNDAESKGLFNNEEFQKKYQQIFFDGEMDMAAKVAAMKDLMSAYEKGNGGEPAKKPQKSLAKAGVPLQKELEYTAKGSGQEMDFTKKESGTSGFTPPDPQEDPYFYEAWHETYEPMLQDEFNEAMASIPEGVGNDKIDPLIADFEKGLKGYDFQGAKKAISGLNGLGKENSPSKEAKSVSSSPEETPSYIGKAHELASKLSDLQHQFKSIVNGGADAATVDAMNNALTDAKITYDKLASQFDAIDELDKKKQQLEDSSELGALGHAFELDLIEASKKDAIDQIGSLSIELESSLADIEKSFAKANETAIDRKKGQFADEVEQQVLAVAKALKPKESVVGVDSAEDMVDSLLESAEADLESLVGLNGAKKLNTKHDLAFSANQVTKAAKQLDDALVSFKSAMDSDEMDSASVAAANIKGVASMLMGSLGFFKGKIAKAKAEAEEMAKLNKAKESLSNNGSSGADVTETDMVANGRPSENTSTPKTEEQTIDDITTAIDTAMHEEADVIEFFTGGGLKELSAGYAGEKGLADLTAEMSAALKPLGYEAWVDADSDSLYNIKITPIKTGDSLSSGKSEATMDRIHKKTDADASKKHLTDEEKKAKIAAMTPKQKLEAAVKIFKKKLAANPNDATAKAKLTKYEAMLSKLNQ